jgi:hypothetical protein
MVVLLFSPISGHWSLRKMKRNPTSNQIWSQWRRQNKKIRCGGMNKYSLRFKI